MDEGNSLQIRLEGVSYTYPLALSNALEGVDLTFEQGEICMVLGRNGSGKSTLARCLNALLIPTEGKVISCGLDTSLAGDRLDVRKNAAMVFQNPEMQMIASTVEDEVAFGPENLGLESNHIRERVDSAMEMVGISELALRQPRKLSQGQKQLVAIAGALAMEPRFLLSDESTSMLDHASRARVLELFQALRAVGLGVVHVTHFLEEALLADTIVILDDGRVAERGSPDQVLSDPERLRGLGLCPLGVTVVKNELVKLGHRVPEGVLGVEEFLAWLYA